MKHNPGKVYEEDRLVIRWRTEDGQNLFQAKRVSKKCPLDKETRQLYIKEGTISALKHLRELHPFKSLRELVEMIEEATGRTILTSTKQRLRNLQH